MPAEGDGSLAMVAIRQNMHYVGLTFTESTMCLGCNYCLSHVISLHLLNPVFNGSVTLVKFGN